MTNTTASQVRITITITSDIGPVTASEAIRQALYTLPDDTLDVSVDPMWSDETTVTVPIKIEGEEVGTLRLEREPDAFKCYCKRGFESKTDLFLHQRLMGVH